jgi:hypothetical protein
VARIGENRDAYRALLGKPDGRRPLGRSRRRREDNIKMAFPKNEIGGRNWIDLTQERERWRTVVNVVINLRVS